MYHQDQDIMNRTNRLFQDITNTPHKRFKPNEDSTFEHSKAKIKGAQKISVFQKLNEFSNGARKELKVPETFSISEFELPLQYKSSSNNSKMDEQFPVDDMLEGNLLNLGRKMTYMDKQQYGDAMNTLNLYRSNSTFDQGRRVQDLKLGDNIYLRQINSQSTPTPARRTAMECETGLRIDQDYEIQKNLAHKRQHESYICLNKLQRVFYYVKKVLLNYHGNQYEQIQHVTSEQVKIYHKDREGSFLKFYQSWFEHNALYMTFEVAIESVEDCTKMHKRLKEVEAWDLLRDCCRSLNWLAKQHNVSHMNIKPGNILKCQRKFKLSDPFLDSSVLQNCLKRQGESWDGWHYLAPELKQFYSLIQGLNMLQSDIYSLGMCIIENLLSEKYFPREGRALRRYMQKHIHGYSPSFMKTLMRMISHDPTKRPTAEQLCEIGKSAEVQNVAKKRRFSI